MAKSNAQIQNEYNEALKVSQSLTGALNKMIDDAEKSQKKLSDSQKKYNDNLRSIYASAQDVESTQQAIIDAEKAKAGLAKRYFGANAKLLPIKKAEADAGIKSLQSEMKRLEVVGMVDDAQQQLTNSLNGSLDGLLSGLNQIPGIGNALSGIAKGPVNFLKNSISNAGKVFTTTFSDATANGASGMKAFAQAGRASMKSMAAAMAGPQAIIAVIVAVLAAGLIAFYRVEKAARAFRDETGLLNSQMGDVSDNIQSVYQQTAGLGASMEDVAKNAATFVNEFGGIEKPSENVIKSLTVMNKNFGVAVGDAVKVNKAFQNMGGLSADVAQANAESLVSLAEANGVAPRKVMADIADSAEEAQGFFRGNIQALGAAAVNAAKMGSSLKEAAKVSRGLLDYQNSVSGEMEASAILGTNLNFSQSRYLAATGDVVGAQAEMVKQLRNKVDLENASVFEIEAMEKATGMQFAQIQNMARLQKLNLGLDKDRNKVLQEAIKGGLDISEMSKEQLLAKTEELAKQQKMQGELESMGNAMSAMGSDLLQAFLPIGKTLVEGLKPFMAGVVKVVKFLGPVLGGAISGIQKAMVHVGKAFGDLIAPFKKLFGGGESETFAKVLEIIGEVLVRSITWALHTVANVMSGLGKAIGGVIDMFSGIWHIFKGIVNLDVGMLMSGFSEVWEGVKGLFGGLLDILISPLKAMYDVVMGLFSSIREKFKNMLPNWAIKLLGGSIASEAKPNESNDPNLSVFEQEAIAKAPNVETEMGTISQMAASGDIVGATNQAAGSDMTEVVSAIRELTNVSSANKDVYMNGKKVTDSVTKLQEKSNINQFGLMGA